MFKQLLASVTTLSLLAVSPAMAMEEDSRILLNTLRDTGVHVEINPPQVCDETKTDTSYHGVYFYSERQQQALMGICQDWGGKGEETIWSENDLDTLRHESIHYLQDCLDGSVDGNMVPIYDGPGGYSPIDYSITDVIGAIGEERAMSIIQRYEKNGADENVIRLELEAFFLAYSQTGDTIARSIAANCPAQ